MGGSYRQLCPVHHAYFLHVLEYYLRAKMGNADIIRSNPFKKCQVKELYRNLFMFYEKLYSS